MHFQDIMQLLSDEKYFLSYKLYNYCIMIIAKCEVVNITSF